MSVEIKVGQIWQEVDPRFERFVRVAALDEKGGRVWVRSVYKVEGSGEWGHVRKLTSSKWGRFNGKARGHRLVEDVAQ